MGRTSEVLALMPVALITIDSGLLDRLLNSPLIGPWIRVFHIGHSREVSVFGNAPVDKI